MHYDKAKWRSPKRRQKRVKNLTSEWNQNYQHFFPHASRSLLSIRFVAVAFRSEKEVSWRRKPPVTYFGPALDPPLGRSGRKTTTLVRDHEYFIPTKFHQNPSSGSGEEVENVKSLRTDDGRQTDRQTDGRTDGRRTVRYDNSSEGSGELTKNETKNKRPKGHLSTMCHLFKESAKADIFVYCSARKTQSW